MLIIISSPLPVNSPAHLGSRALEPQKKKLISESQLQPFFHFVQFPIFLKVFWKFIAYLVSQSLQLHALMSYMTWIMPTKKKKISCKLYVDNYNEYIESVSYWLIDKELKDKSKMNYLILLICVQDKRKRPTNKIKWCKDV